MRTWRQNTASDSHWQFYDFLSEYNIHRAPLFESDDTRANLDLATRSMRAYANRCHQFGQLEHQGLHDALVPPELPPAVTVLSRVNSTRWRWNASQAASHASGFLFKEPSCAAPDWQTDSAAVSTSPRAEHGLLYQLSLPEHQLSAMTGSHHPKPALFAR